MILMQGCAEADGPIGWYGPDAPSAWAPTNVTNREASSDEGAPG